MIKNFLKNAAVMTALMSSAIALAENVSQTEEIANRLIGEFDNNMQSLLTKNSEEPHNRLHFIHTKFPSITDEGINIYVEQSVVANNFIYRQRVYNIVEKNGVATLEIYRIKNPERFEGAHLNTDLLKELKKSDLDYRAGCDISFEGKDETGLITGYTNKDSCVIVSRGVTLNVETRLLLTDNYIDIYDEAYDQEGTPVWQRKDGKGSHMKRARIFDCWSVLRKSEDKKDGWQVSRANRVHDQGGRFNITYEDKSYDISLSQLVYSGEKTREILKLGLHKGGESGTFTYIWTAPDTSNIGVNLSYIQAGCTLQK